MIFTVLGSGTSSGVPTISCKCPTCTSGDKRDKRLRASLLIESGKTKILIDTSPDFRHQMLENDIGHLDAVVYTHYHFDHIGGFDDLRAFNYTSGRPIPVYLTKKTYSHLSRTFFYAFEEPEQIGGGVPLVNINFIDGQILNISGIELQPLFLKHGKLDVLGFRIGDFAYCTDTNFIPDETYLQLEGVKVLILDALRYEPHPTHFTVNEALKAIEKIEPDIAYLTHIAHQLKHSETERKLPKNVRLAYDSLKIEV